jgi:hypothetical protein
MTVYCTGTYTQRKTVKSCKKTYIALKSGRKRGVWNSTRILPISRCYLLFHNSPFSSVVYYGALYRMPWRNPIRGGQFGYPYEDFFNKAFQEGEVPKDWRQANAIPVFKKGEKYLASNYRPVSLTCICCKILEQLMNIKNRRGPNTDLVVLH